MKPQTHKYTLHYSRARDWGPRARHINARPAEFTAHGIKAHVVVWLLQEGMRRRMWWDTGTDKWRRNTTYETQKGRRGRRTERLT